MLSVSLNKTFPSFPRLSGQEECPTLLGKGYLYNWAIAAPFKSAFLKGSKIKNRINNISEHCDISQFNNTHFKNNVDLYKHTDTVYGKSAYEKL